MTEPPDMDRLLYAMCKELVHDRNIWDDCVQEARIAVWKTVRVGAVLPRNPGAYFAKVARNRIKDVSSRQTWLGHTGKHGKPIDPLRRAHDSLDEYRERGLDRYETVAA